MNIQRIPLSLAQRSCQFLSTSLLALVVYALLLNTARAKTLSEDSDNAKLVIGPTAVVEETESDLMFPARVDTGATTSSLHVEEAKVVDEAGAMTENVGKKIRFRIKNHRGESEWLERKIAEISVIKTSEREETRYKVPVTLNCLDVKKRVLVSLNDRSHMTYPVLLGRNFLQGDFVVDVDLKQATGEKQITSAKQSAKKPPTSPKPTSQKPVTEKPATVN
ncbi:MAG: RimK/LysX family protein [Bythopirellula sp.]